MKNKHNNKAGFTFASLSDKGKMRDENQDYSTYSHTLNGHLFAVCDGMGGPAGGAEAAHIAVEAFEHFLDEEYYNNAREALKLAIQYANIQIFMQGGSDSALQGMGTTAVLVLIREKQVFYAHVGDSRLYLYRNSKLQPLTRDHSLVEGLIKSGIISEEEAKKHPKRNVITKALGTQEYIEPEIVDKPLSATGGDTLLLCSDGLTSMLADEQIKAVLNLNQKPAQKAKKMIEMANEAGGNDNISVQLIAFKTKRFQPKRKKTKKRKNTIINRFNQVLITFLLLAIAAIAVWVGIEWHKTEKQTARKDQLIEIEPVKHYTSNEPLDTSTTTVIDNEEPESQQAIAEDNYIWVEYYIETSVELNDLLAQFNVSQRLFETRNNLKPGARWERGDRVQMPVSAVHTVKPNETIGSIAAIYEVDTSKIKQINQIEEYEIKAGQVIYIPI